jgi:hypothetical protein
MQRILFSKEFWIVSVIFILALSLRLPTLASPLIEDEAISFNRYIDKPWDSLIYNYYDTNQHTLFLLLSKFSIWVLGESEIAYRLPSLIAGIFSIPLVYLLGRAINIPWSSSAIAALLMGVSWPHLKYSLEGRGYSLTVFIVLLATYSAIQLLNDSRLRWGSVFIFAGFAMVTTLPSNLFFLGGLAVFTVFTKYLESKESTFPIKNIIWTGIPALITFVLIGVYFLVIYEGLKHGKSIHSLPIDGERIERIIGFLVTPWGPWMYLFFSFGFWRLIEKREKVLFLTIFTVPIILTLVTSAVGFARTYVYWLPFVLLLLAYGMTELFLWIKKKIGSPVYGVAVAVIFSLILLPVKKIYKHYEARSNGSLVVAGPNATLSEAFQMAVWVDENIAEDNLIVISTGGPESSVLNRYMGETVLKRMLHYAGGGQLKKIIFIAHQDMPPDKYPFVPMVQERKLKLPKSKINKIYSLGNLGVYELDLKIEQFIPSTFDPDYEGKIGNFNIPGIDVNLIEKPKVVGEKALYVDNKSGEELDIISPIIKGANISEDHAYLLYVYVVNFEPFKNIALHLAEKNNWPPTLGYLNPSLGMFHVKGQNNSWNVSYSLSPLSKGRHYFQERIGVNIGVHYYDGFRSFLLTE